MNSTVNHNYQRIEKAIKYLITNFRNQPELDELAQHIGVSPFHFQRIFTEWAGISPKKFLKFLTVEALKQELSSSKNILEASHNVGLSGQSRVYDHFVSVEAMTPGEYRSDGRGLIISYGYGETPFGESFIASTTRGICNMQFIISDRRSSLNELKSQWKNATFIENQIMVSATIEKLFGTIPNTPSLSVHLKGTPFQLKVWKALLEIPYGEIVSYAQLATKTGNEKAIRAVASAVAKNPVGYIIPCHRVIRSEGIIGEYHWLSARKAAIIGWEKSIRKL